MRFIALATAVIALVGTTAAMAQTAATTPAIFDMKGTWKGFNEALVDGPAPNHPPGVAAKPAGTYRLRQQNFTYKLDGQDGRRFWGTMSSDQQASTRMIGSLSHDGKWIYMVSKEGYLDGQIIDPDTIEMCYRHANDTSAVIGCNVMKRQK
jgi:hypothetical protein